VRLQKVNPTKVVETLTKDLSVGGLRCVSPTVFAVSADVHVDLTLSMGSEPITVSGRAAWFRTIAHSDQFELGIAFQSLSPETKRRLSAYLELLSEKTSEVPAGSIA